MIQDLGTAAGSYLLSLETTDVRGVEVKALHKWRPGRLRMSLKGWLLDQKDSRLQSRPVRSL